MLNPNWLILIIPGPGRWLHQDPLQGPKAQSLSGHAQHGRRGNVRQWEKMAAKSGRISVV
jgi:hypothetical protein